jgi:hypothetical protein
MICCDEKNTHWGLVRKGGRQKYEQETRVDGGGLATDKYFLGKERPWVEGKWQPGEASTLWSCCEVTSKRFKFYQSCKFKELGVGRVEASEIRRRGS